MPATAQDLGRLAGLVSRENDRLLRYIAKRLDDPDGARDIAQEAYLRILRIERPDLINQPEAYLFRIAGNLIHEYYLRQRSGGINAASTSDFDEQESLDVAPEPAAINAEYNRTLARAVAKLPPITRAVIVMHRRDGFTYEQIANTLGISRHMVKKHLTRGVEKCRQVLLKLEDAP